MSKPYVLHPMHRGVASVQTQAPRRAALDQRRSVATPRTKRNQLIHFRFQNTPNWFTPKGVYLKRKQLEKKGLPNMNGRRFITLTLDPELFSNDPLLAYQTGKDQLRRFLDSGRDAGLWGKGSWWCWKLEFTKEGWAHWHLVIDRTAKFSRHQLLTLTKIWKLGRVNCRRITTGNFGYQFKYAFKGVYQNDESGLCLPSWFLDFYQETTENEKPRSFARARFWQTSKGFYVKENTKKQTTTIEQQSSYHVRSLREQVNQQLNSVIVIARDCSAKYLQSTTLSLSQDFKSFFKQHAWAMINNQALTLSSSSFMVDLYTATKTIHPNQQWKLHLILKRNKMTHHKADQIRHQLNNLHRC